LDVTSLLIRETSTKGSKPSKTIVHDL